MLKCTTYLKFAIIVSYDNTNKHIVKGSQKAVTPTNSISTH